MKKQRVSLHCLKLGNNFQGETKVGEKFGRSPNFESKFGGRPSFDPKFGEFKVIISKYIIDLVIVLGICACQINS